MMGLNELMENVDFGDDLAIVIDNFNEDVSHSNEEPATATIEIDLKPFELKRIMNVEAISYTALRNLMTAVPDTNEAILKKVMVPGDGVEINRPGYYKIHFVAYHTFSKIPFDATRARLTQPLSAHTVELENDWLKGYAAAIKTMSVGEKSIFSLHSKLCFKEAGCPPKIPRNAIIYFYAELLDFDEGPLEGTEEKTRKFTDELARAKDWYNEGTIYYEGRDYGGNSSNYGGILIDYRSHSSSVQNAAGAMPGVPQRCDQGESLSDNYMSLIQAYDNSGSYSKVLEKCLEVLMVIPELGANYKFWLIRGKAARMLAREEKDYLEAKQYLEKALELEPNDATIQDELQKVLDNLSRMSGTPAMAPATPRVLAVASGSLAAASESLAAALGILTTASGNSTTAPGNSTTTSRNVTAASESLAAALGILTTASGNSYMTPGSETSASESLTAASESLAAALENFTMGSESQDDIE